MELLIVIAIIGILVKLAQYFFWDLPDQAKINGEAMTNLGAVCDFSTVDVEVGKNATLDAGSPSTYFAPRYVQNVERTCPVCVREDTGWWPRDTPDRFAQTITEVPYAFSSIFTLPESGEGVSLYCSYRFYPLDDGSVTGTVYLAMCDLDGDKDNGVTIVACVGDGNPCSGYVEAPCGSPGGGGTAYQSDFVASMSNPKTYSNVDGEDVETAIQSLTYDSNHAVTLSAAFGSGQ